MTAHEAVRLALERFAADHAPRVSATPELDASVEELVAEQVRLGMSPSRDVLEIFRADAADRHDDLAVEAFDHAIAGGFGEVSWTQLGFHPEVARDGS